MVLHQATHTHTHEHKEAYEQEARLLLRAMGARAAPYILTDFPRSVSQLTQLEASIGAVACFLQLPASDDRLAESMLKKLRPSGRVHLLGAADAAARPQLL